MKCILKNSILTITLCLTGCSTNTQTENTVVGTLTGALVGGMIGGALGRGSVHTTIPVCVAAGAIIGAIVGHTIDSTDHSNAYPIITKNPMNKPLEWTEPGTHNTYNLTPMGNFYSIDGNPNCRNYHFVSMPYGSRGQFDGTACLMPDGKWSRVNKH